MQVQFKIFESSFQSWHALFTEAAEFASHVDRLISISHSHAGPGLGGMGVVTVWYCTENSASDGGQTLSTMRRPVELEPASDDDAQEDEASLSLAEPRNATVRGAPNFGKTLSLGSKA